MTKEKLEQTQVQKMYFEELIKEMATSPLNSDEPVALSSNDKPATVSKQFLEKAKNSPEVDSTLQSVTDLVLNVIYRGKKSSE